MKATAKLKREILKGAVRENLELLDDRRFLRRRFRGRRWRGAVRVLALILVPAALFVSINAFSGGGSSTPEVLVVAPGEPVPATASPLRAPRPIAPSTFRLRVARVVLDPGHGGGDPGASAAWGLTEKEVTLDVALRLSRLLAEDGFEVSLTRDADRRMPLSERTQLANDRRADLFVSIHVNSAPMPGVRGVETYFLGAAEGPEEERLAGTENAESGYSLADFRKLLEGVYEDVRQGESRRFAGAVQTGLVSTLRPADPRLRDRGVKSAPFVVLVGTRMPAILAEVGCLSDEAEARLLARGDHREAIAEALRRGIGEYARSPGAVQEERTESHQKKGRTAG